MATGDDKGTGINKKKATKGLGEPTETQFKESYESREGPEELGGGIVLSVDG